MSTVFFKQTIIAKYNLSLWILLFFKIADINCAFLSCHIHILDVKKLLAWNRHNIWNLNDRFKCPQFASCTFGIEITYYFLLVWRRTWFRNSKNFNRLLHYLTFKRLSKINCGNLKINCSIHYFEMLEIRAFEETFCIIWLNSFFTYNSGLYWVDHKKNTKKKKNSGLKCRLYWKIIKKINALEKDQWNCICCFQY